MRQAPDDLVTPISPDDPPAYPADSDEAVGKQNKGVAGSVAGGMKAGLGNSLKVGKAGLGAGMRAGKAGMKAGKSTLLLLPMKIPDSEEAVDQMVDAFDTNGDGIFCREEVKAMCIKMIDHKQKVQHMKLIVWGIIILFFLGCATVYGLVIGANEASKETHAESSILTDTKGNAMQTATVASFISLADIPNIDTATLDSLEFLTFSALRDDNITVDMRHRIASYTQIAAGEEAEGDIEITTVDTGTLLINALGDYASYTNANYRGNYTVIMPTGLVNNTARRRLMETHGFHPHSVAAFDSAEALGAFHDKLHEAHTGGRKLKSSRKGRKGSGQLRRQKKRVKKRRRSYY